MSVFELTDWIFAFFFFYAFPGGFIALIYSFMLYDAGPYDSMEKKDVKKIIAVGSLWPIALPLIGFFGLVAICMDILKEDEQ